MPVVVLFPSGKQVHWNQTQAKFIGIHGQVQGASDPVDEEQTYITLLYVYLDTTAFTYWELVSPIHSMTLSLLFRLQTRGFVQLLG